MPLVDHIIIRSKTLKIYLIERKGIYTRITLFEDNFELVLQLLKQQKKLVHLRWPLLK